MMRRKIDRLLSRGEGKQLLWLTVLVLVLFAVFCLTGAIWGLDWTDVLSLYLDPGNFPLDHKGSDLFNLLITLCGMLILSALLISVFSNVFSNIAASYRRGERRYRFKDHVLILGAADRLKDMLPALRDDARFDGKDIVILTSGDVEALSEAVETALNDKRLDERITWYKGQRNKADDLVDACAAQASAIYLIGEDDEPAHDSVNIDALACLREICGGSGPAIPCYVTLEMRSSQDVFQYLPKETDSRLQTEIIHTGDYLAEQLLVETDFLPVPKDEKYLHLVILGCSRTARSVATVAAHISHFPNYATHGKRTVITFIDGDIRGEMDSFIANRPHLFELSHYRYLSPGGCESFAPSDKFGDFLDLEWEFMDSPVQAPYTREALDRWAADPEQELAVVVCYEDAAQALAAALHLPGSLYKAGIPVAVYQKERADLLDKAVSSGMYGRLTGFGEASPADDALLLRRSLRGKRVNYLYDLEYGQPPASSEDQAWAGLSFAHKLSSIASSNSIPLKLRSFGLEATRACIDSLDADTLESLSEVEHRRWTASVLLLGYAAAPQAERADRSRFKELKNKYFIHLDIAPYDELDSDADKDRIIVNNIPYIISGEAIVRLQQ